MLKSKNKFGFIKGTIKRPTLKEEDGLSELNVWEMVNLMICSWIVNVIKPKLHTSVAYAKTACEMWENLRKRSVIANIPKIHQLETDLASCQQGWLEVMEFYSKLMRMWSELKDIVKVPHCTCEKCECGIGTEILKMVEEEKTHQFLMRLNDDIFSTIRSEVLTLNPLPSLGIIFNIICDDWEKPKN